MAAVLSGADLTAFNALPTLESQAAYVGAKIQAAEAAFNTSNPTGTVNRATVTPSYDDKTLTISISLPLSDDAVTKTPVAGVVAYLP